MKLTTLLLALTVVNQIRSVRSRDSKSYLNYLREAKKALDAFPLIDGHNDFAMSLRANAKNKVGDLDIYDLTTTTPWNTPESQTDIKRMRQGKVGAQFWAAYVGCSIQYKDAMTKAWEQIDVIRRMIDANPDHFEFVTSAQEIEDAFSRGKIGSLIGVESGHTIGSSLAVLRMMYFTGVRYLTLTHSCPTPWGDNSQQDIPGNQPVHNGLTPFGETIIKEMNRLGMLIDLSHASRNTMRDAIAVSTAPVIFSHSSAYDLCNHTRNVPDEILTLVAKNMGIVMVNFHSEFISCSSTATVQDVADHIEHIRNVAGIDHVGIGADFSGGISAPVGLEDTAKYPNLFAELLARSWSQEDLQKLAGGNLLRVFREAEKIRDDMALAGVKPFDDWIPQSDLPAEALLCSSGQALAGRSRPYPFRDHNVNYSRAAEEILDRFPLIDGHNDFPVTLRTIVQNRVADLDIYDLKDVEPWSSMPSSHTDIKRLREGKVGAQFWSAYVECSTQYKDAVRKTLEQIEVIRQLVDANPNVFKLVTSAQGIMDAFAQKKIGSLIGVEGGHSIDSSLTVLRTMYSMGARYLTLTHACPTPWADNSQLDDPGNQPIHNGLTSFGKLVLKEMNRLGMLIDLSHVSRKTMRDALQVSQAPVIFSHSSAYAICNNTRNVPDDILRLVAQNGGLVMVTFVPRFVSCDSPASLTDVANHIDHIKEVAGVDHVGIGGDYNGIRTLPKGLEDVSKYPDLFAELLARKWSEEDLEKLAGANLIRVFRAVEKVRDEMALAGVKPFDDWIPKLDLPDEAWTCIGTM